MQEDKNVKKKGFWKGMKSELKKVIWPTGEQTIKSTFATIAFVIMVSLVLIVFNLIFGWLSNLWISALSHEDVINNVVISSGDSSSSGKNDTTSEEDESGNQEQDIEANTENDTEQELEIEEVGAEGETTEE